MTLAERFRVFYLFILGTPFRKSFAAFIVIEFGFIALAYFPALRAIDDRLDELFKPENVVVSQTTFLIALVHGLVTMNTMIFICESFKLVMHASELTKDHQRTARRLYCLIIFMLVTSVSISGFFGWTYAKALIVIPARPDDWLPELHDNERWLMLLFLLFVIADIFLLKICSLWTLDPATGLGNDDVKRFEEDTNKFLRACDVPGLIGIFLIFLLSNGISFDPQDFPYLHGFILGAVGLHITFSQAILAALSEP